MASSHSKSTTSNVPPQQHSPSRNPPPISSEHLIMADSNRSNQNSTQIMDAEGIASSIEGKLVQYLPPPPISQCSIFKVPNMLRRDHEKAFTPEVVSIGPFHRNNTQLQGMENNKLWYLKCLLNRTRTTDRKRKIKSLVEAIESIEQDCRKCYSEVGDLRRDKFIQMMLIDGCFILEFLRRYMDNLSLLIQAEDDPVFKTSWMPRKIIADLLLLENQLPWCVLDCLFNLMPSLKTTDQRCSRLNDLVSFSFSEYEMFPAPNSGCSHGEHKHLLDCFRNSLVGSLPARSVHRKCIPIKSVTELLDLGVGFFRAPGRGNFLDVKFEEGRKILKIPAIVIEENTESVFRNLIAFEHCDPRKGYEITSYAALLDCLIKSPEDARHLEQKHILRIIGLSNEDRASFLNRLLYNNDTSFHGFLYSDLCQDVNKICFNIRTVWKARLRRDYFNEPKDAVNLVYGVIISVYLSLAQTVFAILSYKQASKSAK